MPAYIGTRISRDDAVCKATGQLKFFGDLQPENCLHGAVYRAAHPHAKIWEIHTKDALAVPGVVDVLTWRIFREKTILGSARRTSLSSAGIRPGLSVTPSPS